MSQIEQPPPGPPAYIHEVIQWASVTKPDDLRVCNMPAAAQEVLSFSAEDPPERVRATYDLLLCILAVYARQIGLQKPIFVDAEVDVVWTAMARDRTQPDNPVFSAAVYMWFCAQAMRFQGAQMGLGPAGLVLPAVNRPNRHQRRGGRF